MSVLVFHVALGDANHGRLGDEALKWGWMGVPLFFLISGLLLFRPFAAAIISQRPFPSVRRYGRSRFLRIFPAYWVALTAMFIASSHRPTFGGVLANFSLSFFAFKMSGTLHVAWTLCIELSFYAVLPLIAFGILKLSSRRPTTQAGRGTMIALILLPTFPLSYLYLERAGFLPGELPPVLPGYFAEFTIGMLLAVALELRPTISVGASRAMLGSAVVLLAAANSLYHVGASGLYQGPLAASILFVLTAETAFALALASVLMRNEKTLVGRVLTSGLLVSLGTVSYGIYLWHPFVIDRLSSSGLAWSSISATLIPVVSCTLLLATASWLLIEKPALSRKERLTDTRPVLVATEPASP